MKPFTGKMLYSIWLLKQLLTHYGRMTSYDDIDLRKRWLRQWLVAWRHQAITWTNVDLSSVRSSDIRVRAISHNQALNHYQLANHFYKISFKSPGGQWINCTWWSPAWCQMLDGWSCKAWTVTYIGAWRKKTVFAGAIFQKYSLATYWFTFRWSLFPGVHLTIVLVQKSSWHRMVLNRTRSERHICVKRPHRVWAVHICHYCDVIMDAIASQITSLTIVYSTL